MDHANQCITHFELRRMFKNVPRSDDSYWIIKEFDGIDYHTMPSLENITSLYMYQPTVKMLEIIKIYCKNMRKITVD